jgi:hypothetical protein
MIRSQEDSTMKKEKLKNKRDNTFNYFQKDYTPKRFLY